MRGLPRFVKARPVPYALKAAVETEFDQMNRSGQILRLGYAPGVSSKEGWKC